MRQQRLHLGRRLRLKRRVIRPPTEPDALLQPTRALRIRPRRGARRHNLRRAHRVIRQYPLTDHDRIGQSILLNQELRVQKRVCHALARRARQRAQPIKDFSHEIGIGLNTQDKGAETTLAADRGFIAVYEPLEGKNLGTAVLVDPPGIIRTGQLPATDKARKNEQILIFTRPNDSGEVKWRSGFAWAGDGEITTSAQWLEFLAKQAGN